MESKIKISPKFKETLSNNLKFTTFSLAIVMLEKVMNIFVNYGVSAETMSFFEFGLDKVNKEIQEGYKFVKEKEDFEKIVEDLEK